MKDLIRRFEQVFRGCVSSYGTYIVAPGQPGEKLTGVRATRVEPVTIANWESHILGDVGLGVIPIDEQNNCRWGCIDVDKYTCDLNAVSKKIKSLPFILCRSKSGGAHIFVFFIEPIPAKIIKKKLAELAAQLGFGNCEIFPKQSEVLASQGDKGNWLNLPYFDAKETTRYAIDQRGNHLPLDKFLNWVEQHRLTEKEFQKLQAHEVSPDIEGGPPCLQYLIKEGFSEGMRNSGLFNMGIYAKKAFPDGWEKKIEEFNRKYMSPPLGAGEISTIVKTLSKKDYQYRCKDQPIVSYCNAGLCRTRQFGVGASGACLSMNSLSKLDTSPPTWFLEIEGKRLELETEDLQDQARFQRKCMEALNKYPPKMKQSQWQELVGNLLEQVTIIDAPQTASAEGFLQEILLRFVSLDRNLGKVKEELMIGKPWYEEETNLVHFRLIDLMGQLQKFRFYDLKRHSIAAKLRSFGCRHKVVRIKNLTIHVYYMELPDFSTDKIPTPLVKRDPI